MRQRALLAGDVRVQFKYGIHFLYAFFCALYITLIALLPAAWREKAAYLLVFTDPATMGLFFMGAIVLFERSERVLESIAVSPVRPGEYVLSKLLSIGIVSVAAATLIGASAAVLHHPVPYVAGILLGSALFSASGLILASRARTLNRFLLSTIPVEFLIIVPAAVWLFGFQPAWMGVHPGVCTMRLLTGDGPLLPSFLLLSAWTAIAVGLATRAVRKLLAELEAVSA